MKPSLIQRQLRVNSRIIQELECQIKDDKSKISTVRKLVKLFESTGNSELSWYGDVVSDLNETKRALRTREHNLRGLRDLQKALKKDLKFYYKQMREINLCVRMMSRTATGKPSQYDYYEARYDTAKTKLWMFYED